MKQMTIYLFSLLSLIILMSGCGLNSDSKMDLFHYKNSYVGDNSAVGNIVKQLPHNKELSQISLETKKKPYGLTLEYKDIYANTVQKEIKKTVITNSTYLFTLIKNVDWITFKFPDQEFTVNRDKLQGWYNNNLDQFKKEQDLKKLIQDHLKPEDSVNQFFHQLQPTQ